MSIFVSIVTDRESRHVSIVTDRESRHVSWERENTRNRKIILLNQFP